MTVVPVARFFSSPPPETKFEKLYRYPLLEIITALLFLSPAVILHNMLYIHVIEKLDASVIDYVKNVENIFSFFLMIALYRLYTKYIDKRDCYEIGMKGLFRELGAGFIIGGGMVAIMVALMYGLGYYHIESFNENTKVLFDTFLARGMGAFIEELLFRLILFRLFEKLAGTWYGLITIGLIFGALHYPNPNATLWSAAAIMISDLLLIGAFVLTRRLWLVWGIHFGWNYIQNSVFGMANSGVQDMSHWINPVITGPGFVTGGAFGIEASPISILINLLVGVYLIKIAISKGQIVIPKWKRNKPAVAVKETTSLL